MRSFSPWVTETLAALTLDEKLGQLLHPNVHPEVTEDELRARLPPVRIGGMFIFTGTASDFVRMANLVQDGPGLPVVISSDLESGAGRMIAGATTFPDLMAVGAANDEALARTMGEATAIEGRAYGVHWTFGPVVDLNANPGNPITNTRSLGEDPQKVARLARALVAGMQAGGMAATVKHFPGDGWDDRDQHLATTINPLTRSEWDRHSGVPFRQSFADGCWTTMIGHIALPSVDPGDPEDPLGPPPAILSKAITTDFLRGELGFDGLVISDAIEMNGSISRVESDYELVVRMINAGNDQLLFCDAKRDFAALQKAVACGDISLARVDEACARVLELKEKLGFATNPASARPSVDPARALASQAPRFGAAAEALAQRALTTVRSDGRLPVRAPGSKILVVHLRSMAEYNVNGLDALLREKGYDVESYTEATSPYVFQKMAFSRYSLVVFAWTVGPTWGTNFIRPAGPWIRTPWFNRQRHPQCPVVHVSFGTPYLIHDVPWAETLINAYSPDVHTQKAVVEVLVGQAKALGTCPVDLDRPRQVRDLLARSLLK